MKHYIERLRNGSIASGPTTYATVTNHVVEGVGRLTAMKAGLVQISDEEAAAIQAAAEEHGDGPGFAAAVQQIIGG